MFKRSISLIPSRGNMLKTLPKPPSRDSHRRKASLISRKSNLNSEPEKIADKEKGEIEFGITCINCQKIVPENEIESHSKFCITISEEVFRFENCTEIEQFEFRIKKMIDFLKDKELQCNNYRYRPTEKNFISVLQKACQNLVNSNKLQSKELNAEVKKYIEAMLEKFKASLSLRIYTERLLVLCKEQLEMLERIDQKLSKPKIKEFKFEAGDCINKDETIEKSIIRTTSNKFVPNLEKIPSINSDISSKQTSISGLSSMADSNEYNLYTMENMNDFEVYPSPLINSQEELQKYFYSKCLELKLKYASQKVKLIPVVKLYNKAIENNIPAEEWAEFIEEELKHPEKWIAKERKRTKNFKLLNDPKYTQFDSIPEEEF